MGTAAYGGRGFKESTRVSGERPIGAASCRQRHNRASCQPPPPPPPPLSFFSDRLQVGPILGPSDMRADRARGRESRSPEMRHTSWLEGSHAASLEAGGGG